MRIAIDYDGTMTTDVQLWRAFIFMAQLRGHKITIVTGRNKDDGNADLDASIHGLDIPVVYCAGAQKQDCFGADIWIDDRVDHVIGHDQVDHVHATLNAS